MLEKVIKLLASKNEEHIKQAIELILDLSLTEEIERICKKLLSDSHCELLIPGPRLKALFDMNHTLDSDVLDSNELGTDALDTDVLDSDEHEQKDFDAYCHVKQELIQACLLALLKSSGRLGKNVKELVLYSNSYFNTFQLLSDLQGIESLTLCSFDVRDILAIITHAKDLKNLTLTHIKRESLLQNNITLSVYLRNLKQITFEGCNIENIIGIMNDLKSDHWATRDIEIRLNHACISFEWLNQVKDNLRILKTLEKGLKTSKTVMSGRRLGMILRKNQVHLTKRRQRWFHVLKKLRLCKYYVLADVEFTMIYCARPACAKDFYIGRFPVTQTLWKAIMGTNPSYFQGDDLPVEQISWEDCVKFCTQLSRALGLQPAYEAPTYNNLLIEASHGFRLPFESEWEFAAKGGEAYLYAGSDDLNQVGWYDDNAQNTTHPVGQKLANSYGTYDFCGNIWEWCVDDYDQPNSYNPHATYRAYRGGSWYFNAGNCHISFRYFNLPNQSSFDLGMRIAQSTNP